MERKLLVLDLDETLIFATKTAQNYPADFQVGKYLVYKRPHVDEFLRTCYQWFEVAVWTSASPDYAVEVVAHLFKEKPSFVWSADQCALVPITQRKPQMTEDQFWLLIEKSRAQSTECEEQAEVLIELLTEFEPEEIVKFERLWNKRRRESYRWDLFAVAYIVNGSGSYDGFEYFRNWLIGQGREFFEAVLTSPNHIMTRVPADHEEDVECEDLLYVANRAYEQKVGHDLPADDAACDKGDPAGERWTDETIEELYPELCAFYDVEEQAQV